jgi:hypothetical protein
VCHYPDVFFDPVFLDHVRHARLDKAKAMIRLSDDGKGKSNSNDDHDAPAAAAPPPASAAALPKDSPTVAPAAAPKRTRSA